MEIQRTKLKKVTLTSDFLPRDLMMEILKRLPVKTLIRFLCVCKMFASIIRSGYFKTLFLNESLTRPKGILILFHTISKGNCRALASVQLKNTCESYSCTPSLADIADEITLGTDLTPYVHGLICYTTVSSKVVIHNPSTRRSLTLPMVYTWKRPISHYLGYDPIGNDYKVLCVTRGLKPVRERYRLADETWTMTLGTDNSWRLVHQDVIPLHSPLDQKLCINDVLYYLAFCGEELKDYAVMSFDVRSEKLHLIKGVPEICGFKKLTSYQGKLAFISIMYKLNGTISLWVLEDAFKEEWSNKIFHLPNFCGWQRYTFLGTVDRFDIDDGDKREFIFASLIRPKPPLFRVVYCDMEKHNMRTVTINGFPKECMGMSWYVDATSYNQVDNLMFL